MGAGEVLSAFLAGRLSYDLLVERLKSAAQQGSADDVRLAIHAGAESGRLPQDLVSILLNQLPMEGVELTPAVTQTLKMPPDEANPDALDAALADALFDEPTVPMGKIAETAAAAKSLQGAPSLATGLVPPGATAVNPPVPPSAPETHGPVMTGQMPGDNGQVPGLRAALPEYQDVRDKVEDAVLSSMIGNFQGLRNRRPADEPQRSDGLDGLLVNYKSARFRSNARRGAGGEGLKLAGLDDFSAKRVGVGTILRDRFILDREVGRGGMGVVYAAVDRRRLEAASGNPYVAVKLLNDEFRNNSDALKVLEQEARKSQSLAHPNIATVYDFDRDRSEIYMVMELLTGKPLSRRLAEMTGTSLPGREIVATLKGICAGLAYAHQRGVVHSDLKPGNIFISDNGEVKLIDFGLATVSTNAGFDIESLNALTAPYASPEMFSGAPRDPRDDIYALGCIAYQLLTGVHPFAMKPANQAAEAAMKPEPVTDLDPLSWAAIEKSLAFDRDNRTSDVEEFMNGMFES